MSEAAAIRFAIAVLAAAATLAVFGCGGGSATETASAPSSETTTTAEKQAQGKSASSSGQDSPAAGDSAGKQAAANTPGAAPASGPGTQGAQITPPKGPQEPEPTPQQRAQATLVSMSLTSPALLSPGPESVSTLPAAYTCEGKDTWPELSWGGVPPASAELVLFALNLEPIDEALFFDWAVAGVDPGSTGTQSGQLPKGGVLGRNSFGKLGYSVCPPSSPETVVFALYALPQPSGAHRGFDPTALRKAVLDRSHDSGILAVRYGG